MNNQLVILVGRIFFALMSRGVLAAFVFALFAPLMLGLIGLYSAGYHEAYHVLVVILLFPFFIVGKTSLNLPDFVLMFAIWGIIFDLLAKGLKQLGVHVPNGNKLLHRFYLLIYAVAIIVTLLIDSSDRGGAMTVLIFFFIFGYGAFWLWRFMYFVERTLEQVATSHPS